MPELQTRIDEVFKFLDSKDLVLGYRKFMDCAMDTQNMGIYKEVIELTDHKETTTISDDELIQRMRNILEKISKIDVETFDIKTPVVQALDITKSYGSNRFSLGPVTLEIKKRQVYGLVGENGNGKTTLLRILAKDLQHNQGRIDYNFSKQETNNYNLRTRLVYIPQRTQKWYGSLKDNLKFVLSNYGISPEENETRVLMMIARFGLWNYKHLKWSELSSGYKMRFELARTLLRQPELLLLDEPLANLDVLAQQVILEDLKSVCNSVNNPIALILSSQQLYEVEKISDNVIFLKDGKHKDNNQSSDIDNNELIIEIDCKCNREQLLEILQPLALKRLIFNGGIFVASFDNTTSFAVVLETLGKSQVEVVYTRNISNSTRRFFVS